MLLRKVSKMKSLIIYYSYYNKNTEKIAKILADKTNAEIINLKDMGVDKFQGTVISI